ncbi:non-heme iron oxygenase ferredoxin subunit [Amycolatopsis cihanbeyliensis]|uniref:3-phenylpropionate/trans-cinnamate dioxygenase ferredoxin subunit n=1 Tax=Amycolatopsis cihanbeyliensis TaxID=1128664 RepID=A0A542DF01_AMYCI|nr:non-heme iron oxygenase ferredoxin subunit [Amycolatopsis cihanbeyliensis]TQJ01651.1 3-phenylpropionate/trans-cinnamate dioxygenase ferredoxin subunit [Amycolatopsis cihanbeyliensis]
MAGDPIKVCEISDLSTDKGYRVTSVAPPLAVFLTVDGAVHVLDDSCTHQDAALSDGWVDDCIVECPLHMSRFDLRTGMVDAPPAALPVRVHKAKVVNSEVWVTLSEEAPNLPPGTAPS